MNKEAILKTLDIDTDQLNLKVWVEEDPQCGTACCLGGSALIQAGVSVTWINNATHGEVRTRAAEVLGITHLEALRLFHVQNWPEDFKSNTNPMAGVSLTKFGPALLPGTREYYKRVKERVQLFVDTDGRI